MPHAAGGYRPCLQPPDVVENRVEVAASRFFFHMDTTKEQGTVITDEFPNALDEGIAIFTANHNKFQTAATVAGYSS